MAPPQGRQPCVSSRNDGAAEVHQGMHGAPVVHGPRAGATMPAMSTERSPEPARPLTLRAILFSAAAIVVTGGVVMVLLLTLYGSGSPQDQARLDAVRTAGAIVISFAGAAALLLTARRQRTGALTLEHQQRVAELADHDAAERRVTELYLKAAEQLGSEKAPVRLAGLYALERLGDSNPSQRETVISVICAYLRMPFTHPGDRPAATADAAEHAEHQERSRELQVRTTALRILHRHRTTAAPQTWWAGTVDVDGAHPDRREPHRRRPHHRHPGRRRPGRDDPHPSRPGRDTADRRDVVGSDQVAGREDPRRRRGGVGSAARRSVPH